MQLNHTPNRLLTSAALDLPSTLPPELERLDGITQGVRAFTEVGGGVSYSRLKHSLSVVNLVEGLIGNADLDLQFRRTLELLALVHDVGHVPFSHTGEMLLKRMGLPIDHDQFGAALMRTPTTEIFKLAERWEIKPERMAKLMEPGSEERYPEAFFVKEIADRLAYLSDDLKCGSIAFPVRRFLQRTIAAAQHSIEWRGDSFILKDVSFLSDILTLREYKHSYLVLHPANLVAQEIVLNELERLFLSGTLSEESFYVMSESKLLDLMKAQERNSLLSKIENRYNFTGVWRIKDEDRFCEFKRIFHQEIDRHSELFDSVAVSYCHLHTPKGSIIPAGIASHDKLFIPPPKRPFGVAGIAISKEGEKNCKSIVQTLVNDITLSTCIHPTQFDSSSRRESAA